MTTKNQRQQTDQLQARGKQRRKISTRMLIVIVVLLLATAIIVIWILSYLRVIPSFWASIFTIIITVLGAVFAFFQSMHLFIPVERGEPPESLSQRSPFSHVPLSPANSTQIQPNVIQLPITPTPSLQSLPLDKTTHRGIVGLPPPTDSRTIQQREHIVEEVYTKLIQPGITAIALTGIGGVGKSTLAALIYRHVETQDRPFQTDSLWLTIDPAVTFTDLAGNLFEALGKPLPDLSNLAPQNQVVALFNALNTTDKRRLVILDQFENLLDWDTGHALTNRPGVGEWLDVINSQQCACRILLTSRPRPVGTREFPPTYMLEYPVRGLKVAEGVELLQSQGVRGSEEELRAAVGRCEGHAFSLILLASLIRVHVISLSALFKDPTLWIGDIATNLLDQIYRQQLSEVQRALLLAFSVYREPVPLDAAQVVISEIPKTHVTSALKALRTQHLLEAVGEGRYQLQAIIADYAQGNFDESNEQANQKALRAAHARAAQFYLQLAVTTCPPHEQRRGISDIHDLIEASWQMCQAEQWQEAYDLMEKEWIIADLNRWGGYAILLELSQLLLSSAKWQSERSRVVRFYNNISELYRALGRMEQAQEFCTEALSYYREVGDRRGESQALSHLAMVSIDLGRKVQARECYEQALNIYREMKDRLGEGMALNGLAWINRESGQKEKALMYYQQALSIRREMGHYAGEAETLSGLGLIYSDLGEKEESLRYYKQALNIRQEVRDRGGEGRTLNGIGLVYFDQGEWQHAYDYFRQSLNIRREIGDRLGEGVTLYNIGKLYFKLLSYEITLASFVLAKSIFNEIQSPNYEATQGWIDTLHRTVGDEKYTALSAKVEPQASQIVEEALRNGL